MIVAQRVLPAISVRLLTSQLLAIKTLSMDMNAGYIRAARIHLPNAVEKIAFDRFHVAKQLGEVVDKTRQNEHPHLPVESRRQAKRYPLPVAVQRQMDD
ncbi:putative transposase [Escherichia coli]|uniref:Putative transposase n=1 Tax=Escherichia coli TaxID=562 RepID=A0A376LF50_ECOLX|nr:putative transposase [Escherichia coli]